ncbi:MAG: FAD-dependent oxidoreductase [Planctomycetaceae bacterium]|nr:FAD-dependent oxidoreductase [Planctomycetaceae bacterium]
MPNALRIPTHSKSRTLNQTTNQDQAAKRIVIVGGVAGGASAAARARRLSEDASILMIERGAEASFANCGLPYYIGGEIADRSKLLVAGKRQLQDWLNLDVRTRSEVKKIVRDSSEIEIEDLETGRIYREPYDYLVLSTGAAPIRPAPLLQHVGQNHPRVLSLRNMTDVDQVKAIVDSGIESAVVIGAGFIGLEVTEQLVHRGIKTRLVEQLPQVMPPFDAEMVQPLHQSLREREIQLHLADGVAAMRPAGEGVEVELNSGEVLASDLVLLSIGVRPESDLAKDAGLLLNDRGAVQVDSAQRTNDPKIFAVGDAVEVAEPIFGGKTFVPLGGPANRQGRLAADKIGQAEGLPTIGNGDPSNEGDTQDFQTQQEHRGTQEYRGTQGTSIVRLFDWTAGMTGMSEKSLQRLAKQRGKDYACVYAHPNHHAGYYPGATPITLKLVYELPSGRVLGAQAIGKHGVDKRIDVIAMAIQMKATVLDLEQAELCYAPPFGSAKDAVNMVGFIAANQLRGLTEPIHPMDCPQPGQQDATAELQPGDIHWLDVRTPAEFAAGAIAGAINLPLEQLRERIAEVPRDKPIIVYCHAGQRGYYAERMLRLNGVANIRNLSGGFKLWQQFQAS